MPDEQEDDDEGDGETPAPEDRRDQIRNLFGNVTDISSSTSNDTAAPVGTMVQVRLSRLWFKLIALVHPKL